MRTFHYPRLFSVVAMLLLAAGWPFGAAAQNSLPRAAVVTRLQGKARFSNDKKTWQTAQERNVLSPGAVIQTAQNSTVDLSLNESERASDMVRLAPSTVLTIIHLMSETSSRSLQQTELDLNAGEVTGRVGELAAGSRYEITFPNGVVGIRHGGTYRLTASGILDVLGGEAVIVGTTPGLNRSATLTAGYRLNSDWTVTEIPANPAVDSPAQKTQPALEPKSSKAPANPMAKKPGMGGELRKF